MQKTLFTFPVSVGLKRRVAAKWFRRYWRHNFQSEAMYLGWLKAMENVSVGSVVSSCKGLNIKIEKLEPEYFSMRGGKILLDVLIESAHTSCTAYDCGVGPALSYEQVIKNVERFRNHPLAKEWGWDIRYSSEVLDINSDGTYSVKK
jgi:hypothetical protein